MKPQTSSKKSTSPVCNTYSQNRLIRSLENRKRGSENSGNPIPGIRSEATIARLMRRKARRVVIKDAKAKEKMIIDERNNHQESLRKMEETDANTFVMETSGRQEKKEKKSRAGNHN